MRHTIDHLNPDYMDEIIEGINDGSLIVLVCTGHTDKGNEYLTVNARPFTLI